MHEHTFECLFLYFEFVLLNYKKEKYSGKKCHKDQDNNYGKLNAWILNILLTSHFCFLFRFFVLRQPQALLLMLTFRVNWNITEHSRKNFKFKTSFLKFNIFSKLTQRFPRIKYFLIISNHFSLDAGPPPRLPNCCICSPPLIITNPLPSLSWSRQPPGLTRWSQPGLNYSQLAPGHCLET